MSPIYTKHQCLHQSSGYLQKVTPTGDGLMVGEIIRDNMDPVLISVIPQKRIGSLFDQLIYSTGSPTSLEVWETRTQAVSADRVARSYKVPCAVLKRANTIGCRENPYVFYGDSYKAIDPQT